MRTRKDENLRKPSSFIEAEKSNFPGTCSKQCPIFFFCQAQLYSEKYYQAKKNEKKIKDENLNWHSSLRKLPKKNLFFRCAMTFQHFCICFCVCIFVF